MILYERQKKILARRLKAEIEEAARSNCVRSIIALDHLERRQVAYCTRGIIIWRPILNP
jgi:hypothetical protein